MFDALPHTVELFTPLYHGAEAGGFPVETIPDGSIWYPHHFWTGLFVAVLAMYADRRDGRPLGTMTGILTGTYAWLFLWHNATSPFWGAAFSLFGVTLGTLAVVGGPYWRQYPVTEYPRLLRADLRRAWLTDLRAVPRRIAGGVRWVVTHPGTVVRRTVTPRVVALIGMLIAADDAVDHALPVTTPLQRFWVHHGHELAANVTELVAAVMA